MGELHWPAHRGRGSAIIGVLEGFPHKGSVAIYSRLALLALATLVGLSSIELGLRVLTEFPVHDRDANRIPHASLGYVMDPRMGGIDEHGFRNEDPRAAAHWIAIGDSHTYGFNVASRDSWPQQAARSADLAVYNMGVGGYGILQYRLLFDQALARGPEAIVLALYLANDLSDYCAFASLPYWQEQLEERGLRSDRCKPSRSEKQAAWWIKKTAIGSALELLVFEASLPQRFPKRFLWFRYGENETVVLKGKLNKHAKHMNPEAAAFPDAVGATEHLLGEMIAKSRTAGVAFGVLLVPSKQRALAPHLDGEPADSLRLERAVAFESELTERIAKFLDARGVSSIDPTDCLRSRSGEKLYPRSKNGHPLSAGYACYSAAAIRLLGVEAGE